MKGVAGLVMAIAVGIAGGTCNWFYLYNKSRQIEMVDFIGIAAEAELERGDRFREDHLTKVSVPKNFARALEGVAYKWEDRATIVYMTANRAHREGEILLRQDLRTRPDSDPREQLGVDEVAHYVSIDPRHGVPALIPVGARVSFIVPKISGPLRPAPIGAETLEAPARSSERETIGPFRVISVGNRLGSVDVHRSSGQSLSQSSVLGIAVKMVGGEFEPIAQKLLDRIATYQQPLAYVLHGKTKPK